jgi:hypothetical protein
MVQMTTDSRWLLRTAAVTGSNLDTKPTMQWVELCACTWRYIQELLWLFHCKQTFLI